MKKQVPTVTVTYASFEGDKGREALLELGAWATKHKRKLVFGNCWFVSLFTANLSRSEFLRLRHLLKST